MNVHPPPGKTWDDPYPIAPGSYAALVGYQPTYRDVYEETTGQRVREPTESLGLFQVTTKAHPATDREFDPSASAVFARKLHPWHDDSP